MYPREAFNNLFQLPSLLYKKPRSSSNLMVLEKLSSNKIAKPTNIVYLCLFYVDWNLIIL